MARFSPTRQEDYNFFQQFVVGTSVASAPTKAIAHNSFVSSARLQFDHVSALAHGGFTFVVIQSSVSLSNSNAVMSHLYM